MTEKKFKSILESKTVSIVLSLLLALLLWLFVTGTEGVTTEKVFHDIKVTFKGTEELSEANGLLVTGTDVNTVDLTLTGLRRDIALLSDDDLSVTVDLTKVKSAGYYALVYTVNFPDGVKEENYSSVHGSPDTVAVTIDRVANKKVDVRGSFTGSAADGYMVQEKLIFDPLTVRVSGPKALVDQVDCAWVTINRDEVDASLSYMTSFTLLNAEGEPLEAAGLTLDVDEVRVTMNVLLTKTVALKAAVIPGGGAGEEDALVTVFPASITLAGSAETLDAVNQIVVDTVKLANVNPFYEAKDILIPIPNDTLNLSGITTAEVRVEIQNLQTTAFSVDKTAVVFTNAPEGFTAECITESLPILLRGSAEDMGKVALNNIRLIVDLAEAGAAAGIHNLSVKISLDGFPDVGAVGEYKAYIRLDAA